MVANKVGLVLIQGAESLLADRAISQVIATKAGAQTSIFSADELEVGFITDSLAHSLFADARVVDSRDAARACLLAINSKVSGEIFNVCGPDSFKYVDVSSSVAEKLGRTLVEVPLPDFHSYTFDISKAQKLLNFTPEHSIQSVLAEAFAAL